MREKLTDEQSDIDSKSAALPAGEVKDQGEVQTTDGVPTCEGSPKAGRFEVAQPKGSSITMEGAGRHDGSDINNSLSLLDMYNLILRDRAKQRSQE